MAIDFGLLSKQSMPTGGVVAQLPQQQNPVGELGQGIMRGLAQGQQIQLGAQQGQLNDLALQKGKQEMADSQAIREAAKTGEEAVIKAHESQGDYGFRFDLQKKKEDVHLIAAQVAGVNADTKIKNNDVINSTLASLGNAANSAQAVQQQAGPEAGQKQWDMMIGQLDPATQQNLKDKGLDKFTPTTYTAFTTAGMIGQAAIADKQKAANLDPLEKNQNSLDKLTVQKNLAIHNNQDTTAIDKKINETQDRIDSLSQGQGQNKFSHENVLRDEVNKSSIPFQQVNDSYGRILASAKDPSPAGDLALIFNYMKMLDPGSTVREGEFATAQNSGSLPEILRAKYNKIKNGKRLDPEQRADFVKRSGDLYKSQEQVYQKTLDNVGANVIQDIRIKGRGDQASPDQIPQPGKFQDGQVYQDANGLKAKYVNGQWQEIK